MKNKEKRKRPITKKVRFNESENEYILRKLKVVRLVIFKILRGQLLIMGEVHYYDYTVLKKLVSEVNMIGQNINQLVKIAHQFEEVSTEDIRDMTYELVKLRETVEKKFNGEIAKERRG